MNAISFIFPVYNIDEAKIKMCFDSIYGQISEEDEMIFVDDGSAENIAAFLDTLKRDRVIVIHQKNSGVSVARNTGLSQAKNKWIMFMDPDDYVQKDSLAKAKEYLKSNKDIYIFDYYAMADDVTEKKYAFFQTNEITKEDIYRNLLDSRDYIDGKNCIIGCGVPWAHCYKREFLEKNNLKFDPRCIRCQDNVFNMFATSKTNEIELVHYAFYVYRFVHCRYYYKEFKRKSLDYLPYLAEVRTNFFATQKVSEKLYGDLIRNNYGILISLLRSYILNRSVPDSPEEKKKYYCFLKSFEPFKLVCKDRKYLSLKPRTILFFYRTNQLWTFKVALKVKSLLRRNKQSN